MTRLCPVPFTSPLHLWISPNTHTHTHTGICTHNTNTSKPSSPYSAEPDRQLGYCTLHTGSDYSLYILIIFSYRHFKIYCTVNKQSKMPDGPITGRAVASLNVPPTAPIWLVTLQLKGHGHMWEINIRKDLPAAHFHFARGGVEGDLLQPAKANLLLRIARISALAKLWHTKSQPQKKATTCVCVSVVWGWQHLAHLLLKDTHWLEQLLWESAAGFRTYISEEIELRPADACKCVGVALSFVLCNRVTMHCHRPDLIFCSVQWDAKADCGK